MPIIKQAEKKLRRDKKKTKTNAIQMERLKTAVKLTRKNPTPKNLTLAYKLLDKAVKVHLIHRNKSARLKSRLAKKLKK